MIKKQQELFNLQKYCDAIYEKHEIKFQPHNPPVDLILDELLGAVLFLKRQINALEEAFKESQAPVATEKPAVVKKSRKKDVKND